MGKTRKCWLLSVMLFLTAVTWSSLGVAIDVNYPKPLSGIFEYSGELSPVLKIEVETVYALSQQGTDRLKDLKTQRYSCGHVMRSIYRCIRQIELKQFAGWEKEKVEKKISSPQIHFLPKDGGVEEESDGDAYKSWRVDRPVETVHGVYKHYLWTWTPNISKIILKDKTEVLPTVYLNLSDDLNIYQQFTVNKTIDKNRFVIHVVRAHFVKQ